jgi:Trk-type K+ transport system membrane component
MDVASESGDNATGLKICHLVLHPLLMLSAALCLLSLVGWTGVITGWQHWLTLVAGLVFAFERTWLMWREKSCGKERRRLMLHEIMAVLVFIVSVSLIIRKFSGVDYLSTSWHVFIQLGVIFSGIASIIHHQTRLTARAFHPGMVLIGSFFAIIVIGTLLLKMPRCVLAGETCSWLDAAFTSTSAVCVTGLSVQNTALFFSQTGQVVILILIQIGGLGIMTLTFFAAVVLFEGLSLHDRLLLGRMISENRLSRIGKTLTFIVLFTFTFEAIGAVILYVGMDPAMPWRERAFHSVFHAVSAFCNAGFSTFPDNLASVTLKSNVTWQVMIMILIVCGGLGSMVVEDLCQWAVSQYRKICRKEYTRHRLRIHTRLVLVATGVLLFGGAFVIMATEFALWNGPENGGKFLTAMFHSVTARTAGFNTVSMSAIGPMTINVLMILMLIGGSPGGTAGGIRTTVVALGLGHLWSQLRMSKRGLIAFNRTIPAESGGRALGLMLLAVIWLTGNFMLIQYFETDSGISDSRLLFELISAFATVGLSIDLTSLLSDGGKTLLIVNMFVGRIGLLTVMVTMIPRDTRPFSGKPQEDILLN